MKSFKITDKRYPDFLHEAPIWALRRKNSKIPYSAKYYGYAKSNDPSTWATFDEVINKLKKYPEEYDGISLAITPDYSLIFVDVDNCIAENGEINYVGAEILKLFQGCYIEVSSSGSGLHVITRGSIPKSIKNSQVGIEIYSSGRFCALTGLVVSDGPLKFTQDPIVFLYEKYKKNIKSQKYAKEIPPLNHQEQWILKHACKNYGFSDLWEGNWEIGYKSQSEADLALCGLLAFWTNCNAIQMDRLFKHSGLYRDKWDRPDYKKQTIEIAIKGCKKTFNDYLLEKEISEE